MFPTLAGICRSRPPDIVCAHSLKAAHLKSADYGVSIGNYHRFNLGGMLGQRISIWILTNLNEIFSISPSDRETE